MTICLNLHILEKQHPFSRKYYSTIKKLVSEFYTKREFSFFYDKHVTQTDGTNKKLLS